MSAYGGLLDLPEMTDLRMVHREVSWRRTNLFDAEFSRSAKAFASRWTDLHPARREAQADGLPGYHTLAVVLRHTNLAISVSGKQLHEGPLPSGTFFITGPNAQLAAAFRGPCEYLHIHLSDEFIDSIRRSHPDTASILTDLHETVLLRDMHIERLARSLLITENQHSPLSKIYLEGVCQSILARLALFDRKRTKSSVKSGVSALPGWRLRRAFEYIEQNLSEQLTLNDIANAVGLTRMYFAAQFRIATGMRPHDYVLRRRIERAQCLMLERNIALVHIALEVGFQTQSHFSNVFKRYVGDTPVRWRNDQRRHTIGATVTS